MDVIGSLINQFADLGVNINVQESNHRKTPLMIACEKGYISLVQILLARHASPRVQSKNLRTPLHYSIDTSSENLDVVRVLIENDPEIINI